MDRMGSVVVVAVSRRLLTPRLHEVLELVTRGYENKAIAAALEISEETVKDHVSALLRRYGVTNRAALAEAGLELRVFGGARHSSRWLRYLFREAPFGVAIFRGKRHMYHAVNDAYRRVIGGRDVVGQAVADAFADTDLTAIVALLDSVWSSGEPRYVRRFAARWDRRRHGVERGLIDVWIQPTRDDAGDVDGLIVYVTDLTERDPSGT